MTVSSVPFQRVTIVGLGLLGGSIAKGLRARCPRVNLLAVDRGDIGSRADVQGVVDTFIDLEHVASSKAHISASELIVLCQPVRAIAASVGQYLSPGCTVTDTGSTKRHIASCAAACPDARWFVPGHPMAGKEQGGFENADAELFSGRPWIVCTEGREPEAVARVEGLVTCLGAQIVTMTAEAHDEKVAVVSHVPQLLASWLRVAGSERQALAVAGPAFADMTRTAGGAEAIWRDIFETNADEVGRVLRDGALALAAISDALLAKPPRLERVIELLERARSERAVGARRKEP